MMAYGDTFMACGHTALASDKDGNPVCPMCSGYEAVIVLPKPPLEGRLAQCSDCKTTRPSRTSLPFFEYRGVGSKRATDNCKLCGMFSHVHPLTEPMYGIEPHDFVPHGAFEYDQFYCGCRGWE